jgi:epoxyqueuosine reductase
MVGVITSDDLTAHAAGLGLAAVGAAPAGPYAETEAHIRERAGRGLLAEMGFTTRRPEVSCHPERLVPGARSVVSAALSYWAEGPEPGPGEGRLPRYAWGDPYTELRSRLAELGERLGGAYRVLVDDNDHVDREGARRAGLGFYGKNTMLIAPGLGSWIVLGTLVTEAEVEPSQPVAPGCGSCTLCIDACPTGALDEPGVLDANRCLSWTTQRAGSIPEGQRAALGVTVYGCDVCQDVCPWNRGPERRQAASVLPPGAEPIVSLREWLEADPADLRARLGRLYVAGNDGRLLQRNALVALGNGGGEDDAPLLDRFANGDDSLLAEHARWALARIAAR